MKTDRCMTSDAASLVGKDPAVISPLISKLFATFDRHGIEWAVLHGGDSLPAYTRRDIDVLFRKDQIRLACKVLQEVVGESRWICYAKFRFSILRSFWLILPGARHEDSSYLQLDFYTGSPLRGLNFYREAPHEVLTRRVKTDAGVWCLADSDGAAYVLVKELLANGRIDRQSRKIEILAVYDENNAEFKLALKRFRMQDDLADRICEYLKSKDWVSLSAVSVELKKQVFRPRLSDIPGILRHSYDLMKMFFCPFLRLFVVIVGPDGCGKTSVADRIEQQFKYRPFFGFMRVHGNFESLPRLRDIWKGIARLAGKKVVYKEEPAPSTRHMGMKPPLARFRSMLYVAYYGIEYWLGRLKLRKWRTFSGMVIADRYFCDYFYMRGHMNCPTWWKKMFEKLAPKPDLIFALERPAEDIYAQKPELTVEEIKREQDVIRAYLKGKKSARIIDASHGLDATVDAVAAEIEKWLLEKVR